MIIGLTGYAGSGKSTAARHLVERHGFTLVKFAGPLKSMMRALGLGEREIEGDLKEVPHRLLGGRTPRHAMQTLGTEWGRNLIHSNLWVNAAMASAHAVLDQGGRVVFDDVRFPNEVEAVRAAGGMIFEIWRPGIARASGHASEAKELANDGVIVNEHGLEEFERALDLAIEWMRKGPCE